MHWARMHDELFFVTKGSLRFTTAEGEIDAPEGSLLVAPPRASHCFENVSQMEEAEVYMTATPGESTVNYARPLHDGFLSANEVLLPGYYIDCKF